VNEKEFVTGAVSVDTMTTLPAVDPTPFIDSARTTAVQAPTDVPPINNWRDHILSVDELKVSGVVKCENFVSVLKGNNAYSAGWSFFFGVSRL